jgi:hypothetical protein
MYDEAKGGPRVEAHALAERVMSDEDTALDALALGDAAAGRRARRRRPHVRDRAAVGVGIV